jgi:DNA-binding NarL/FixJ family response regulator
MPDETVRIVIADDHPLFRSGLKQAIQADPAFEVIAEAGTGDAALELIAQLMPDVAILDLNMPGLSGFEVIAEMRRRRLPGEVVVLTMHQEEAMLTKALSLGVRGYVLKTNAATEIVDCLTAVRRGDSFTSSQITSYLFKRAGAEPRPVEGLDSLTPTERVVLRLIADYKTSREIAAELGISHRTVENHRNNICAQGRRPRQPRADQVRPADPFALAPLSSFRSE